MAFPEQKNGRKMEILKGKIRYLLSCAQLCTCLEPGCSAWREASSEVAVIHLCSNIIILRFAAEKLNWSAESRHI